ncbi:MAG: hypothetical protein WDO73_02380 [Ignavibacteriota bacterium]
MRKSDGRSSPTDGGVEAAAASGGKRNDDPGATSATVTTIQAMATGHGQPERKKADVSQINPKRSMGMEK